MVDRLLIIIVISFISCNALLAEVDIDATLTGTVSASKTEGEDITSSGVTSGSLTIKSPASSYVKSQLTLDFTSIRSLGLVSISKAWIKFRYPLLRVTLGKNRITWGEGNAFNAGDVIFDDYTSDGTSSEDLDLTADELKSLNRTMAHITFPLGRFTFLEGIYLPYDFLSTEDLTALTSGSTVEDESLFDHSGGGRFVTKVSGVKLESGYIYNGSTSLHKPYISLNGTLGVDYQLSASINIYSGDYGFDDWKDSLKVSSGVFYLFDLEDDKTLTLRLETLILPYGDWESDTLYLYPEISFVQNDELSYFIRSIINPLNINIESTLGLNWKTYQGFTIGAYYTTEIIEDESIGHNLSLLVTHKF